MKMLMFEVFLHFIYEVPFMIVFVFWSTSLVHLWFQFLSLSVVVPFFNSPVSIKFSLIQFNEAVLLCPCHYTVLQKAQVMKTHIMYIYQSMSCKGNKRSTKQANINNKSPIPSCEHMMKLKCTISHSLSPVLYSSSVFPTPSPCISLSSF